MYDKADVKKIFRITHMEPRKYDLPKNLSQEFRKGLLKLELSKTGFYTFASSRELICLYRRDKEEPIYRYEK